MALSCAKQGSGWILGKKSQKSHEEVEQASPGRGRVTTPGGFQETCVCCTECTGSVGMVGMG